MSFARFDGGHPHDAQTRVCALALAHVYRLVAFGGSLLLAVGSGCGAPTPDNVEESDDDDDHGDDDDGDDDDDDDDDDGGEESDDSASSDLTNDQESDPSASDDDASDDEASSDESASDSSGGESDGDDSTEGDTEPDWEDELKKAFPADQVVALELTFEGQGLEEMVDAWNERQEKIVYPASLRINGQTFEKVGARLKGYSSLLALPGKMFGQPATSSDKLPLRIDFDEYDGPLYHYLEKLSVDNTIWDPSFMHQRMSARMYNAMGVPASATAYARVKLDGTDIGLTVLTQVVDKKFLRSHFGSDQDADDGNLYKCVNQAESPDEPVCLLGWKGDQKANYLLASGCEEGREDCGLVLKTNEDDAKLNDYADLITFLDVLNNSSDSEFPEAIAKVFDVDSFLRTTAVTAVLVNLDSYFGRVNNYYLYHRPDTDKFVYLPWDFNLSYGGYPCRGGGSSDLVPWPVDDPVCRGEGGSDRKFPLIDRILAVPKFAETYRQYLQEVVMEHFTREGHEAWIKEFDPLVAPELSDDPNFGYTVADHERAISEMMSEPKGGYDDYNLMDFVVRRRAFIVEQLAAPMRRPGF